MTHGDINIFTQIGFVVLVGLASKNAILIVEFAKHKHEDGGLSRREATLEACQLRLRPILMTSFAFILGVVPLLVGHGAGAEMRRTLGTAVFSGMLGVTLFGIFLTPVFFYVIEGFVGVAAVLLGAGAAGRPGAALPARASLDAGPALAADAAAGARSCVAARQPGRPTAHGRLHAARRRTRRQRATQRNGDDHDGADERHDSSRTTSRPTATRPRRDG